MVDMSAESTALAFHSGWVSRFSAPTTVITDCRGQFELDLWRQLIDFLGTSRYQTHPISWADSLPRALLSVHSSKKDLCCIPADLVCSQMLHLPREFPGPPSKVTDINDQ